MEFRICPACQQSVLDDEAKDCPFCGTSMSAKPTAARAAAAKPVTGKSSSAPPAKPVAPAAAMPIGKAGPVGVSKAASTATASPAKSNTAAPAKSKSNDPFDVEVESLDKLFPVRPKPGGGALHQVKCPMCEKVGYVPEKLIGRKVKCYNPACMVPAYVVPVPVKVVEEVKPPRRNLLTPNVIIFSVLGLFAIGGFGAWYFFVREKPHDPLENIFVERKEEIVAPEDDNTKVGQVKDDVVPELTPAEIVSKSLDLIVEASFEEKGARKTQLRQMAAKGFALASDFVEAEKNLVKITEIERRLKFQEIGAWVAISWQAFQDKNLAISTKALEQAMAISEQLPTYGIDSNMTATEYASRVAAASQAPVAMAYLRKFTDTSLDGLLASWLVAVRANRTFDVWREWQWRSLLVDPFPQATAVSRALIARGVVDQAVAWQELLRSEEAQMHALAGMLLEAELIADASRKASTLAKLMPLIEQRSKAEQAFIHSRVALVQHYIGRDDTSLASYDKANALLTEIALPKSDGVDDLKGIYEGRSYSQEKVTLPAAGAYSNLARCCLVLKKRDAYDALVRQAIQMSNLTLPSFVRIESLVQNLDKNSSVVRQDLARALSINNATDLTSAFNTYRKNLTSINAIAQRTREFQVAMLSQALLDDAPGLVRSILEENSKGDPGQMPLIETRLIPSLTAIAFQKNDSDLKQFIASITGNRTFPQPDLVWTMELNLQPMLTSGKMDMTRQLFQAFSAETRPQRLSKPEVMLLASVYGSRLAGEKRIEDAFFWVDSIKDQNAREEAGRLITSLYSLIGEDQAKLQHDVIRSGFSPSEQASMHMGIAEGVLARNPGIKLAAGR